MNTLKQVLNLITGSMVAKDKRLIGITLHRLGQMMSTTGREFVTREELFIYGEELRREGDAQSEFPSRS